MTYWQIAYRNMTAEELTLEIVAIHEIHSPAWRVDKLQRRISFIVEELAKRGNAMPSAQSGGGK